MPMLEARRAKKIPPGFSTRHISLTIDIHCASSVAKWRTALLMTTSKPASANDICSTGSMRKLSCGRCGASDMASRRGCAMAVLDSSIHDPREDARNQKDNQEDKVNAFYLFFVDCSQHVMQACFVSQSMPDVPGLKKTYYDKPENRKDQTRNGNALSS